MSFNKLIAFVYFWAVAKLLGPHVTGTYFFSTSVTSLFVVISDLGITQVIILSYAGAKDNSNRILGAATAVKLVLTPIAILAALGYGVLRHVDSTTMTAVAVACLVMAADTFHLMIYSALRGKQDLRPEALGMLIGQILTATFSITAAFMGLGAIGLVCGLLLGSTWNVVWVMSKKGSYGIHIAKPTWLDAKYLMRAALPFAIAGLAVKFYSYIDTMCLQAFRGLTEVGVYAIGYKMTYALQFIPMTVTAAVYPALAASWAQKDHEQIKRTYQGTLRLMAFMGFSLAAGLSALAPRIVLFFYGSKFLGAVAPFEVMPWVLLALFMDYPVGSLLNSSGRAHQKTTAMVITMFVSAIANLTLVPWFGAVGAAWAGVITFWGLFFMGIYFSRRDAGGWKMVLGILSRALAAAAISWVAWHEFSLYLPFVVAFVLGSLVAIIVAFAFRIITTADFKFFAGLRNKKLIEEEDNIHADA